MANSFAKQPVWQWAEDNADAVNVAAEIYGGQLVENYQLQAYTAMLQGFGLPFPSTESALMPPSTLQSLRRTGRTTRMLKAAVLWAHGNAGQTAIVLVPTRAEVMDLSLKLSDLMEVFRTPPSVAIMRYETSEVDWGPPVRHKRYPGRVFVDPHLIEERFPSILDLYHAYDAPIQVADVDGLFPDGRTAQPVTSKRPPKRPRRLAL